MVGLEPTRTVIPVITYCLGVSDALPTELHFTTLLSKTDTQVQLGVINRLSSGVTVGVEPMCLLFARTAYYTPPPHLCTNHISKNNLQYRV